MSSSSANSSSMGRVAVVTGSNKGIGYFIGLHLATSGLFEHVILACRNIQLGTAAVESMESELIKKSLTMDTIRTVKVSSHPLTISDTDSHQEFVNYIEKTYGKVDCLVNNAAIAFKSKDPTPFEKQTKPTLDVNFRGTIDFTERMLPLIRRGSDPRIVNVASMAGRLSQISPELQKKFSSNTLTIPELHSLVNDFEQSVQDGTYREKGWSSSNYGMSKLALIAATKVLARENPGILINSCCPGYCKTDMTSQMGLRPPSEGANNAVIPATVADPGTGEHYSDYKVGKW